MGFFGIDKVVFASDAPFDPDGGPMYIRDTIRVIDDLDMSDVDRLKIYNGNACKLLQFALQVFVSSIRPPTPHGILPSARIGDCLCSH